MNGRAHLNKEDQARGQSDLKHAYDGVQKWAVEVVLMRMGVLDEYVRYQTKLTIHTRTAVVTPLGLQRSSEGHRGYHKEAHTDVHCGMAS